MTSDSSPNNLSSPEALQLIRQVAQDSKNIIVSRHALDRQKQRKITMRQIEQCLLRGTIIEGPFVNDKGNWQVSMHRHGAGEKVTCVVAIDWPKRLIIVTAF